MNRVRSCWHSLDEMCIKQVGDGMTGDDYHRSGISKLC